MNISALSKLEKGYVKWDWKEYINRSNLTVNDLELIIDKIDNFKSNRSAKELVLFKLKNQPIYITVVKSEYSDLLEWVKNNLLKTENYELCSKIELLKTKL